MKTLKRLTLRRTGAKRVSAGAELWAANCNRCHNAPAPTAFSAAEWDLILQHMRMRANLTGQEARTVADFLKAGS